MIEIIAQRKGKAYYPFSEEDEENGLKPWEKFGTVLEEYLDNMQAQGKQQEALFDQDGNPVNL